MKRKLIIGSLGLIFIIGGGFLISKYVLSKEAVSEREKSALPSATSEISAVSDQPTAEISPTANDQPLSANSIPEELNLDVPFTSQAPNANWDFTHEEACEEAAILMAGRYYRGQKFSGADDAEKGLQEIIAWEKENLGFFESTTADETVKVIEGIYGLQTQIIENPTVEQLKIALAQGKLVLSPSAGRQIGNPFYKSPGPLYHMLLIKGYTKEKFITNDAGTKRGENYPYKFETILNANHDWNAGNVENGKKVMIIVSK